MELTVTVGADTVLPSGGEPGSVARRRRGDGEQLPMLSEWEGARGEKGLGVFVGGTSGLGRCEVGRRGVRCGATNEWERGGACVGGGGSEAGIGVRARLAEEMVGSGRPAFMLLCLDFC